MTAAHQLPPSEREAFEAEIRREEAWGHRSLKRRPDGRYQNWQVDWMWDAWQARASLPTPQQATPTRATREAEQRERMQARLAARPTSGATADFDLPAPNDATQQATPEPVGEPWGCGMIDLVSQLVGALEGMLALDEENHQRYPGDEDVCKEVQAAQAALSAAKAKGADHV